MLVCVLDRNAAPDPIIILGCARWVFISDDPARSTALMPPLHTIIGPIRIRR